MLMSEHRSNGQRCWTTVNCDAAVTYRDPGVLAA